MTTAEVRLWDRTVGAVTWSDGRSSADFEYDPAFVNSGIQVAPLTMPLARHIYSFPGLSAESFRGLPGLLADSLPDDFGNALINAWLARQGRDPSSFNPVERLCYTGNRGMGALEYRPTTGPPTVDSTPMDLEALVELASDILNHRDQVQGSFQTLQREDSLQDILRVGTSAGGARAKAVIAWHPDTHEVRSGQVDTGKGFEHWMLKFDGVSGNRDKELEDPKGYGLIEYAYYEMALAAGINMRESRLLEEGGRNHFMTRRFDRTDSGRKLHMLSLAAIAHFDYRKPGDYSYEQALRIIQNLGMSASSVEQMFRRIVFNVLARNQDDHVKNIAFLMDRAGQWSLAPAFDVTYSYNPGGLWTGSHQMSLNGKRDNFELEDFRATARAFSLKRGRIEQILEEVGSSVHRWKDFAAAAGVSDKRLEKIGRVHRKIL